MSGWNFHNPVQIHFGVGCRTALQSRIAGLHVLAVSTARGRRQIEADTLLSLALAGAASLQWVDNIIQNPGLAETQGAINGLSGKQVDVVLALGGGSAMDAAKALAAALALQGATRDLKKLISAPAQHLTGALPIVALPTTSGTGAEVTPFATIWDHEAKKKLSLASPYLFPEMAIIDPELTFGVPREATLSTGLDALNQAFESVWNRNASSMTHGLAGRAIGLALAALPRLHETLSDQEARIMMAEASVLAGLSISQTRTAVCHAISYPLTAHFGLAHGWACAVSMKAVACEVFEKSPIVFDTIAPLAGFATGVEVVDKLEKILVSLSVRDVARKLMPNHEAVMALIPEMFAPGRSENFILPVDEQMVARIVRSSI